MKYKEKSYNIACDYVKTNYKKVDVTPWYMRYNYKCHLNCVQHAKLDGLDVYSCYYIEKWKNTPIAHFLNYDKKKKMFIENTLWWTSERHEYYIVNKINEKDYYNIYTNLAELKESIFNISFRNSFKNWLYRLDWLDLF